MSETKRIINLVVSIITGLAAIGATILFINEPMSLLKGLAIYFAICFSLAIVEFIVVGFSHFYEKIDAIHVFNIVFSLTFIVGAIMLFLHVTPWLLALCGILINLIIMLLSQISALLLGAAQNLNVSYADMCKWFEENQESIYKD